jgi:hypothetical protein
MTLQRHKNDAKKEQAGFKIVLHLYVFGFIFDELMLTFPFSKKCLKFVCITSISLSTVLFKNSFISINFFLFLGAVRPIRLKTKRKDKPNMYYDVPYKTKQFFFALMKLSIVIGAFYFIYSKLSKNENLQFNDFITFLQKNDTFTPKTIVLLLILSVFNWFFEILKWQYLVKTIKQISFRNALEQSLGGATASLITPNRIGDYGAKAVYYAKPFRTKIMLLNLLGNMAQMTITTVFGVIGLLVFVNRYQIDLDYDRLLKFGLILLLISLFAVIGIKQNCFKIKGFSFEFILNFVKKLVLKKHLINLSLSLIRYFIFSFQFYYLLIIFGVDIEYTKAMVVITSMYFLASILPSISIFDVVIKGSVAVFLFGYVDVNELTILTSVTIMWLLNFVIPSVFGSYFVLNFKLPYNET